MTRKGAIETSNAPATPRPASRHATKCRVMRDPPWRGATLGYEIFPEVCEAWLLRLRAVNTGRMAWHFRVLMEATSSMEPVRLRMRGKGSACVAAERRGGSRDRGRGRGGGRRLYRDDPGAEDGVPMGVGDLVVGRDPDVPRSTIDRGSERSGQFVRQDRLAIASPQTQRPRPAAGFQRRREPRRQIA